MNIITQEEPSVFYLIDHLITETTKLFKKHQTMIAELRETNKLPELTKIWNDHVLALKLFSAVVPQLKNAISRGDLAQSTHAERQIFDCVVPELEKGLAEVQGLSAEIALKLFHEASTNRASSPNMRSSPTYPFSPEHIARYAQSSSPTLDLPEEKQ